MDIITAQLHDIATYVPDQVLDNSELARVYPEWSAEKIFDKTGISTRHIAAQGQTAGDMAFEAAKSLFSRGGVSPEDVDFIIFCSQTPDYILPATACLLQDRLKISANAGAMDINIGCSGFIYALSIANGLIGTGTASCVLLLTADTYSKLIHPLDKSVRTLFGDGASATVVTTSSPVEGSIGPFVFGTDGSGSKNLIVESGMFRLPKSADTALEYSDSSGNIRSRDNLCMNGADVMAFALREVPTLVESMLQRANRTQADVDHFIMHQANRMVLDSLRRKVGIPTEKYPVLMHDFGNTVSSSIPIAIAQMRDGHQLQSKDVLMLIGFGVGYSWGACIVQLGSHSNLIGA